MRRSLALAALSVVFVAALPAGASARVPASPRPRSAAAVKAERIRAYEEARADLFELEGDQKRRRFRHHWLNLAKRLDAMGDRKDHPRRCEALYNAGRAFTGLAELSYLRDDRQEAVERYRRLARACPKSNLADDALLRAAELLAGSDPRAAKFELDRLFRLYPDGDMAPRARVLARELKVDGSRPPAARVAAAKTSPGAEAGSGAAAAAAAAKPDTNIETSRSGTAPASAAVSAGGAGATRPAAESTGAPVGAAAASGTKAPAADPLGALIAAVAATPSAAAAVAAAPDPAPPKPAPAPEPAATGTSAPAPATAAIAAAPPKPAPAPDPASTAKSAAATKPAPATDPPPAAAPATPDAARLEALADLERSTDGDLTLSALAGLKIRRVVIDPGHGGTDPGAIGRRGTHEATITLAIAQKLRRHLENLGLEVLLTRETDTTVSLEERTAFANERRADLFLSIHCNAAENRKLRGVETYTLNLNSDRYAMRLAARENAGSERSVGDLQLILADLATKANTDDSVRLAAAIHRETVSRLSGKWKDVKDLGTKQALFFVLLGARMPAVLLETSFLSHPEEEARLRTAAYQEEIARGIAAGVRRFLSDREAIARAPGVPE
jgi:N-acetylmuramoyl-L-alanine amidase